MADHGKTTLSDLVLETKDGDWGQDSPADGFQPYYVIRGTDFPAARRGNVATVPIRYLSERTASRRTLQPNDVLIETAGGSRDCSTGRTLFINKSLLKHFNGPATCASFARFLRIDSKKADPRFVYWYLQDLHSSGGMWEHQVQHTGVARFQFTRFASTHDIPLPSRRYQGAAADILDSLDDKIAVNDRINEKLDELSRSLFRQCFIEPAVGGLPPGWHQGRLSDICTTQYGYTASATDEARGPKFLRVKDINKKNWIEWDSVPHCDISTKDQARYSLSVGDIVVARMADPGKSAIIEDSIDAVFASYLVRLNTQSLAHSYYIYGFLKSDEYAKYSEGVKSGSVQSNMNAKVIVGVELSIPPMGMLESYLAQVVPLRRRLMASVNESRGLAEVRDVLLPRLMSGAIRVRDAEKVVEDVT